MIANQCCREYIEKINTASIDLIIIDPPYGKTDIEWDKEFEFTSKFWAQIWRVLKLNAAILIWGTEPQSSRFRLSQSKYYKYDWYWLKSNPTGHLNAKKQPLRNIETVSVFYRKQCLYQPQLELKSKGLIRKNNVRGKKPEIYRKGNHNSESQRTIPEHLGYPKQILQFDSICGKKGSFHPTEKPIPLLEYLIRTYTNEGDMVLDFFAGSGSTLLAAKRTKRKFRGCEISDYYFNLIKKRLEENAHLSL